MKNFIREADDSSRNVHQDDDDLEGIHTNGNLPTILRRQGSLSQRVARMICSVRTVRVKEWLDGHMYARASEWPEHFPAANGSSQSPVNIVSESAVFDSSLLTKPLTINYCTSRETDILNDGQNVTISPRCKGEISGGPFIKGHKYELTEIRLHWGRYSTRGSEHKVNGKAFPMEVQLVHWNSHLYQSYEEALGKENGIAIVASFIQTGKENSGLRALFPESLIEIAYKGRQKTTNALFNPACLIPDAELRDYWTYGGSLTIPICLENVTWMIFRYPVMFSAEQVDDFRKIFIYAKGNSPPGGSEGRLLDNVRPVQPLNGRTIRSSFQ